MTPDEITSFLTGILAEMPENLDATPDEILATPQAAPATPTALALDSWSIRRGQEWAYSELGQTQLSKNDKLTEDHRNNLSADMLAACWEPSPRLAINTLEPRRQHFLGTLMETPEYESLHRDTALDDLASEIATVSLVNQWFDTVAQPEPEDELDKDAQAMQQAQQAVKEAKEQVDSLNDMRSAIAGSEDAQASSMNVSEVKEMFNRVKNNRQLRRIMALAGKYRRLAQSMQAAKPVHGCDDVVGIELGQDLGRLIPSELVQLDDEDLEYDFLRRFAERGLMQREVTAHEAEAEGPIMLCVDESGSMRNDRICQAKALALAILWVAEHQKRWCCLSSFSNRGKMSLCVVEPGKRDPVAIAQWLESFLGGGTDCQVPLVRIPEKWAELGCPEGKTDMIVITDCCLSVPEDIAQSFNAWKATNRVKSNTIVIGNDAGDMAGVSDRHWTMDELELESNGVSECLAI